MLSSDRLYEHRKENYSNIIILIAYILAYCLVLFLEMPYITVANVHFIILQPILNSGITSVDENRRKTFLNNVTAHCNV